MENKQALVKTHFSIKRRKDSARNDDVTEYIYAPRSPGSHQSKKNVMEARNRSLAEGKVLPKVQTPTKYMKNNKPAISWRNDTKQDISIEAAGKPIMSPKNKFKKIFKESTPHKPSFSMQEPPGLNDSEILPDMKSMKTEIDRLNNTIEAMKEFFKEEERSLHIQITFLKKELDYVKSELSKTVEFLASVIGKHMDKETPQSINDDIIEILKEKQEALKLNLEAAISSVAAFKSSEKFKIELSSLNNIFQADSSGNLPSTGRFQNQSVAARSSESEQELENSPLMEVIALYDFYAGGHEHLEFKAGDRISVLAKLDEDWWIGTNGGKTGKFPSSYVLLD
ncbi:unnamed protein product [Blepharisma stoltei]|uniref:SH3 domain-containing protein n=1 Tax=Blepharisma stoltei TaxID=1481888 RepID=A0AAU9JFN6_9CILI|nr:unnamed protein product [Blepharisma stoltei]